MQISLYKFDTVREDSARSFLQRVLRPTPRRSAVRDMLPFSSSSTARITRSSISSRVPYSPILAPPGLYSLASITAWASFRPTLLPSAMSTIWNTACCSCSKL